MALREEAKASFEIWYHSLKRYAGGFPARGTIGGALVVLDRLIENFDPDINAHTAGGGAQIKGASGDAVGRILERYGESRPFLSEGGRTNRGLRGDIKSMLVVINSLGLEVLTVDERNATLQSFQVFLVDRVRDYHNSQRLEIVFDGSKSTWQIVHDLLEKAGESRKAGPVAQYLIGAKIQLRFPHIVIDNHSYSTADIQLVQLG